MPITKEVTVQDITYTFRLPDAIDMVQIDVDALKLREGISSGLGMGVGFSVAIATLERLCVAPEKVSFKKMPHYIVDHIGSEVSNWIDSFRVDVGGNQGTAS